MRNRRKDDRFGLYRFVEAQEEVYETVVKDSH